MAERPLPKPTVPPSTADPIAPKRSSVRSFCEFERRERAAYQRPDLVALAITFAGLSLPDSFGQCYQDSEPHGPIGQAPAPLIVGTIVAVVAPVAVRPWRWT